MRATEHFDPEYETPNYLAFLCKGLKPEVQSFWERTFLLNPIPLRQPHPLNKSSWKGWCVFTNTYSRILKRKTFSPNLRFLVKFCSQLYLDDMYESYPSHCSFDDFSAYSLLLCGDSMYDTFLTFFWAMLNITASNVYHFIQLYTNYFIFNS